MFIVKVATRVHILYRVNLVAERILYTIRCDNLILLDWSDASDFSCTPSKQHRTTAFPKKKDVETFLVSKLPIA